MASKQSLLTTLKEKLESSKDVNSVAFELKSYSQSEKTKACVCDEKDVLMDIYSTLLADADSMNAETLLNICLSLKSLAHVKHMQAFLISHSNIVEFLCCYLKAPSSYEIRRTCSEALISFTYNETNQKIFANLPGFTTDICNSILNDSCDLRPQLISILGNLTRGVNTLRLWVVSDNELSRRLMNMMVCFVIDPLPHSLHVFPSSTQHANCSLVLAEFASLLQNHACAFLSHVAYIAAGAQYLCNECPGFISHLMSLTAPGKKSSPLQHNAYMTLCNLSGTDCSHTHLLGTEHHLISNVVSLLCQKQSAYELADYKKVVLIRLLWGLAVVSDVKVTIVLGHQEVISVLLALVQSNDSRNSNTRSRVWVARLFVRLAESSNVDVIAVLLSCHAHKVFLQKLQMVCEFPKSDWESIDGHVQYMLSFVMTLSRHPMCMKPLKQAQALAIMEPIIFHYSTNGSEALKAMIVTAFLVGRDENTSNILHAKPEIITLIVDVLDRTLHGQHGPPEVHAGSLVEEGHSNNHGHSLSSKPEYRFGTFRLHLLLRAVCVMSVSDANKTQLVASDRLIFLLSRMVIGRYLEAAEAIIPPDDSIQPGGGGGDDVESAELALETLLQLSFVNDEDGRGQEGADEVINTQQHPNVIPYSMEDAHWLLESLDNLLCNSEHPQYKKLSHEGIRSVICLRSRLATLIDKKKKKDELLQNHYDNSQDIPTLLHDSSLSSNTTTAPSRHKSGHVMISYCWHEDAKPSLVKELANHLRKEYGYDVWRDEDGSAILSPMHGSTINHMARAVELASVVIVCVSQQYKESANCRMESVYAHQRHLKNKLEIIFVMMQEHYTTQSSVETVDGWLGIMVAEELWYPLYSSDMVATAAKGISQRICGHCSAQPTLSLNDVGGYDSTSGGGSGSLDECASNMIVTSVPTPTIRTEVDSVIKSKNKSRCESNDAESTDRDKSNDRDRHAPVPTVLTEDMCPLQAPRRRTPVVNESFNDTNVGTAGMSVLTRDRSGNTNSTSEDHSSPPRPHMLLCASSPISTILPLPPHLPSHQEYVHAYSLLNEPIDINDTTTHLFSPPRIQQSQQRDLIVDDGLKKHQPRQVPAASLRAHSHTSEHLFVSHYVQDKLDIDKHDIGDDDCNADSICTSSGSCAGGHYDKSAAAARYLQEAFQCLTDSRNSLLPTETSRLLSILGIRVAGDLTMLDSTEVKVIAGYLKLIPARQFVSHLQNCN